MGGLRGLCCFGGASSSSSAAGGGVCGGGCCRGRLGRAKLTAGGSEREWSREEERERWRKELLGGEVRRRDRFEAWWSVAGCDEVYRRGLYHEIRELVARNVQTTFEICRHEEEIDIISLSGAGGEGSTSRTAQMQQPEGYMARLTETVGLIKQDLTRTFPNNEFYRDEVNLGKLGNVIASYAGINREVGYCQGMNFLAGMLLQLSEDEEDTFWLLTLVMVRYNLQSLFTENIPLLHLLKFQYQLLFRDHLPRLEQHFTHLHVTSELYAVKWFFSLFAYSLPENTVFELWDFVFAACPPNQLHNGFMRAILIVALAIVTVLEKDLLNTDSIPEVLDVFEVKLKQTKPSKILKVARQIDKLLLQANIENSRAIWAALPGNAGLNEAIAKGELVALLMPAAILQFEKNPPAGPPPAPAQLDSVNATGSSPPPPPATTPQPPAQQPPEPQQQQQPRFARPVRTSSSSSSLQPRSTPTTGTTPRPWR